MKDIEEIIGKLLIDKGLSVSTAESCTGGLVSSRLTDVSGSSHYIKLNFVTYSNEAKQKILNVSAETLTELGAVSEQTVVEMANGARKVAKTDIGLSTSGIAGPTGGTKEKPVGTCYICVCDDKSKMVKKIEIAENTDRKRAKNLFSQEALLMLKDFIEQNH